MSDTMTPPLETPPARTKVKPRPAALQNPVGKYALIGVWAVMAAVFWFTVQDGLFRTSGTFHAIFGSVNATVLIMLALAALSTLIVGEFDLSFASVMGISAATVAIVGGQHHQSALVAVLAGMAVALLAGLVNAIFVVTFGVSSFVVTLGMSTVLTSLGELITHNNFVAFSNGTLKSIATHKVFTMPLAFYYGIGLALVMAYVLAWMPIGRSALFVGANPEVARLAGVRVQRIRFGSYLLGATFAGLAGVLVVASVGSFDNSTTGTYLLPALAAVFLSTAVIQPGVFNPIGAVIAIFFLQTGIIALQLMGSSTWVVGLFYGGGLVIAVSISKLIRSRTTTH
ncbi:ABC transporter permease [Streptomyces brasiliensis]|uniref:Monosaccharide-transporting ATPase n=1 Tax=Streptomyces brasiliensis TaxID=1954 RepID=A0A917NZ72_9ACTN|nr:ABC transporter permease [Streptomyces brasiliensis]GGJ42858.1 monosaccharide-transporting ATPase [Streptomyces brasiliensis]